MKRKILIFSFLFFLLLPISLVGCLQNEMESKHELKRHDTIPPFLKEQIQFSLGLNGASTLYFNKDSKTFIFLKAPTGSGVELNSVKFEKDNVTNEQFAKVYYRFDEDIQNNFLLYELDGQFVVNYKEKWKKRVILFFVPILISLIATLSYSVFLTKRAAELSIFKTIILNSVILLIVSIWWFYSESDGLSQLFGIMYYGIAFVVISIINTIFLWLMKKKTSFIK